MLGDLNKAFDSAKANIKNNQFIVESVTDDDAMVEEMVEEDVDSDSIPDDVYAKIDKAIDGVIGKDDDDYEDAEDLLDDDDIDDEEIDIAIDEAANAWYDNEKIGHPDQSRRDGVKKQPIFDEKGSCV